MSTRARVLEDVTVTVGGHCVHIHAGEIVAFDPSTTEVRLTLSTGRSTISIVLAELIEETA